MKVFQVHAENGDVLVYLVESMVDLYEHLLAESVELISIKQIHGDVKHIAGGTMTAKKFLAKACLKYGYTINELRAKGRDENKRRLRIAITYVLMEKFGYSLGGCGDMVNRDRSYLQKMLPEIHLIPEVKAIAVDLMEVAEDAN
jgi:hypothetical protein